MDEFLINLLLYLEDKDIETLALSNFRLNYFIYNLYRKNYWWRLKVEKFLGINFGSTILDWYDVYSDLTSTNVRVTDSRGRKILLDIDELAEYALMTAAMEGHLDTFKALNIYGIKNYDRHYLALASAHGYLRVVKFLVTHGANPAAENNAAVQVASLNGHLDIVKFLSTLPGVNVADVDNEAIINASKNGHLDVIKFLLTLPGVNPTDQKNEAIINASKNGHLDVIKFLLTLPKVNSADQGNLAIRKASENGHVEVVKLLLKQKKVNPALYYNYAIRKASENGHTEVVRVLLQDKRVNPLDNRTAQNALELAKNNKHFNIVKLIEQHTKK